MILLPLELTETKQPCYDIRIRFKGVRKRCRKVEAHSVELAKSIPPERLLNATGTMPGSTLADLIDLAKKTIQSGYKIAGDSVQVTIKLDYVKRSRERMESGTYIISTEFEPFGPNHHSHVFMMDGDV